MKLTKTVNVKTFKYEDRHEDGSYYLIAAKDKESADKLARDHCFNDESRKNMSELKLKKEIGRRKNCNGIPYGPKLNSHDSLVHTFKTNNLPFVFWSYK